MVMYVRVVLALALLQVGHLSSVHAEETDSPHVRHRRDADESKSLLEWKESQQPPKDAVTVFDKKTLKMYYVARTDKCLPCFYESVSKSCLVSQFYGEFSLGHSAKPAKVFFLVNKDRFELLEWKKSVYGEIPPGPVEVCTGMYLVRNDFGLGFMTENSPVKTDKQVYIESEVLTMSRDIKGHHLTITQFQMNNAKTSEEPQVLKHFTASNFHCEATKHQFKLDQGVDKTVMFTTTRSTTEGDSQEVTLTLGIPKVVSVGGKLGMKLDEGRMRTDTTSEVGKTLHSVTVEVQVPAAQFCSVDVKASRFKGEVPYTGQLTRTYRNGEERTRPVSDVYRHQEFVDIQTVLNRCQPLPGVRC